jgi:2-isopropylmalate synthase
MAATGKGEVFGVGIDSNIVTASIKAIISGINRLGVGAQIRPVEQAA